MGSPVIFGPYGTKFLGTAGPQINPTNQWLWSDIDDCIANAVGEGPLGMGNRSSGGSVQRGTLDSAWTNRNGVYIYTITTAAQVAAQDAATDRQLYFGQSDHAFRCAIFITTLDDTTDTYILRAGFDNNSLSDDPSDAVYIMYQKSVSDNWVMVANDAGSKTSTASNVAVTTGWHNLEVLVLGTNTAKFFVDGVSLGTISTNIPDGGNVHWSIAARKKAGTNARTFYLDWIQGGFRSHGRGSLAL